jgi:hypothetical protein
VVADQPVEQHLVGVVQGGQVDVLGEVTGLAAVLRVGTDGLVVQVEGPGRKQTDKVQRAPLLVGERGAPVQPRIRQHRVTPGRRLPSFALGVPGGAVGIHNYIVSSIQEICGCGLGGVRAFCWLFGRN